MTSAFGPTLTRAIAQATTEFEQRLATCHNRVDVGKLIDEVAQTHAQALRATGNAAAYLQVLNEQPDFIMRPLPFDDGGECRIIADFVYLFVEFEIARALAPLAPSTLA